MKITGDTLVCDLLRQHPEVFPVFAARGMCDDCREQPPPVPVAHFAAKHCHGDLEGFIAELHARMVSP